MRADLLRKELSIFTFGDLLFHYPYRHVDKTQVAPISSIVPGTEVTQVAGKLISLEVMGETQPPPDWKTARSNGDS